MILLGNSVMEILVVVLLVLLIGMLIFIGYRKMINRLNKGKHFQENFCVLHSLESNPVGGEVEFYYESKQKKTVALELLNMDLSVLTVIDERMASIGGNIIRFNTSDIPDGNYYYRLKTENQKTMKKFQIKNR